MVNRSDAQNNHAPTSKYTLISIKTILALVILYSTMPGTYKKSASQAYNKHVFVDAWMFI